MTNGGISIIPSSSRTCIRAWPLKLYLTCLIAITSSKSLRFMLIKFIVNLNLFSVELCAGTWKTSFSVPSAQNIPFPCNSYRKEEISRAKSFGLSIFKSASNSVLISSPRIMTMETIWNSGSVTSTPGRSTTCGGDLHAASNIIITIKTGNLRMF
jgi:hypothetical protein